MDKLITEIEGVFTEPLSIIRDERGAVMHMLRAETNLFVGFGEIYFSLVKNNSIKAWKRHRAMIQSLAVPIGSIRLVVYDDRPKSPTIGKVQVIDTGISSGRYEIVRLPPMVWYGFSGLGEQESLIANCSNMVHDAAEVDRLAWDNAYIPYAWPKE
jgi:dTDP-4-dehydrorhamnose 3,5-epimerase